MVYHTRVGKGLKMVSKFAFSRSQKLKIFSPRRGGASGRRGHAPQGRRGQDFTVAHVFVPLYGDRPPSVDVSEIRETRREDAPAAARAVSNRARAVRDRSRRGGGVLASRLADLGYIYARRAIPIKRNKNMRYSEILAAPALRRVAAPARGAAPARRENFEFLRPRERKFAYHL